MVNIKNIRHDFRYKILVDNKEEIIQTSSVAKSDNICLLNKVFNNVDLELIKDAYDNSESMYSFEYDNINQLDNIIVYKGYDDVTSCWKRVATLKEMVQRNTRNRGYKYRELHSEMIDGIFNDKILQDGLCSYGFIIVPFRNCGSNTQPCIIIYSIV